MVDENPDRESIVSEGRYAVVAGDDADAEYRTDSSPRAMGAVFRSFRSPRRTLREMVG